MKSPLGFYRYHKTLKVSFSSLQNVLCNNLQIGIISKTLSNLFIKIKVEVSQSSTMQFNSTANYLKKPSKTFKKYKLYLGAFFLTKNT